MTKTRFLMVLAVAAIIGTLALWAEVKTSNRHYTQAQYNKYVGPCMSEAVEALNTDAKIQAWLNKCIPDKAGTRVIRRTGWAPRRPGKGANGRPWLKAWNPRDPRMYNAYQYCMGRFHFTCKQKCRGRGGQKTCLPQCKENLNNCILNYYYTVVIEQNCQPGVSWFNPDPKNVWLPAQAVMDDRKMPHLYQCLAPFAKKMSFCRDCHQLKRCTQVCRNGRLQQIAGAKNIRECVAGCRKFFVGGANYQQTGKECPRGACFPFR